MAVTLTRWSRETWGHGASIHGPTHSIRINGSWRGGHHAHGGGGAAGRALVRSFHRVRSNELGHPRIIIDFVAVAVDDELAQEHAHVACLDQKHAAVDAAHAPTLHALTGVPFQNLKYWLLGNFSAVLEVNYGI